MRKGKSFTTALLIVYKNFSKMKNDELGAFLQRRGIPFHGRRKKERIIIAQAAKNLAFPPLPTPEELRTSVVNDKENLLGIENGTIKLPDPEKLLLGWQSKLDNLPNISSVEVIAYIDQRKFKSARTYTAAFPVFLVRILTNSQFRFFQF